MTTVNVAHLLLVSVTVAVADDGRERGVRVLVATRRRAEPPLVVRGGRATVGVTRVGEGGLESRCERGGEGEEGDEGGLDEHL